MDAYQEPVEAQELDPVEASAVSCNLPVLPLPCNATEEAVHKVMSALIPQAYECTDDTLAVLYTRIYRLALISTAKHTGIAILGHPIMLNGLMSAHTLVFSLLMRFYDLCCCGYGNDLVLLESADIMLDASLLASVIEPLLEEMFECMLSISRRREFVAPLLRQLQSYASMTWTILCVCHMPTPSH